MADTKSLSSTTKDKDSATLLRNVLVSSIENVPISELVHRRSNISSQEIRKLSIGKFNQFKQGITFNDLINKFKITKRRAQRKLKDCHSRNVLFIPEFENHKPQRYFPSCLRADVLEYLTSKNVHVGPTVPNEFTGHPLHNAIEHQKAQNLLDILLSIGLGPLFLHKLHLHLSIPRECYHQLIKQDQLYPQNKAKVIEERIGKTVTKYTYSPNGKVQVYVACSNNPFRIQTERDETILFASRYQTSCN